MREVFFATPTFTGHPSFEFCGSMEETIGLLMRAGVNARHRFHPGLQFIEVARNILCTEFLRATDATDIFFVDDDVGGWPPSKVIEFLNRPEPIVAGVYPFKTPKVEFPTQLALIGDNGQLCQVGERGTFQVRDGIYRATQVPAGFCRIKREVIEHFARTSATYGWKLANEEMMAVFDIYRKGPLNGEYVGEDMNFSARCIEDGIEMWVDPWITFKHRGSHLWEGCLGESIKAMLAHRPDLVPASPGVAA